MKSQAAYVLHINVLYRIFENHNPDHCTVNFNFSVISVAYFEATILTDNKFVSSYSLGWALNHTSVILS